MKKKSMFSMLFVAALLALMMFPGVSLADAVSAGAEIGTGSQGWDMALTIVLPVILAVSSVLANFFIIKPEDPPVLAFIKRIINTLALNLTKKAGQ